MGRSTSLILVAALGALAVAGCFEPEYATYARAYVVDLDSDEIDASEVGYVYATSHGGGAGQDVDVAALAASGAAIGGGSASATTQAAGVSGNAEATARATGVDLLDGLVRADEVVAVAHATSDGDTAAASAGSRFVGLTVGGVPVEEPVPPNTRLAVGGAVVVLKKVETHGGRSSVTMLSVQGPVDLAVAHATASSSGVVADEGCAEARAEAAGLSVGGAAVLASTASYGGGTGYSNGWTAGDVRVRDAALEGAVAYATVDGTNASGSARAELRAARASYASVDARGISIAVAAPDGDARVEIAELYVNGVHVEPPTPGAVTGPWSFGERSVYLVVGETTHDETTGTTTAAALRVFDPADPAFGAAFLVGSARAAGCAGG